MKHRCENAKSLERADVIVVLGCKTGAGNGPAPAMRDRIATALTLYRNKVAPYLLLTGGRKDGDPPEGQVMADLLRADGLPDEAILMEPRANNTLENAIYSTGIMAEYGLRSAYIVTHWWHIPRAKLVFGQLGLQWYQFVPAPSRHISIRSSITYILRELVALPYYCLQLVRHRADLAAARAELSKV